MRCVCCGAMQDLLTHKGCFYCRVCMVEYGWLQPYDAKQHSVSVTIPAMALSDPDPYYQDA